MKVPFILPLLITRPVLLIVLWVLPGGLPNLTEYIMYVFGQVIYRCYVGVYIVDGVRAGRCAASAATTWAPSSEESLK